MQEDVPEKMADTRQLWEMFKDGKYDVEKAADKWSGDTLIASDDFEIFRRARDYSERSVIRFAKEQGIAPGIVVGRMQLEGMIKYTMLNNLKEKYEIAV